MTSCPRLSDFQVSASSTICGDKVWKFPANTTDGNVFSSRKAFASLLWRAFPSPSEHDLARKASRVLDVSERQVKNWLHCDHSAPIQHFFAVAAIAGAEIILRDRGGRT